MPQPVEVLDAEEEVVVEEVGDVVGELDIVFWGGDVEVFIFDLHCMSVRINPWLRSKWVRTRQPANLLPNYYLYYHVSTPAHHQHLPQPQPQ